MHKHHVLASDASTLVASGSSASLSAASQSSSLSIASSHTSITSHDSDKPGAAASAASHASQTRPGAALDGPAGAGPLPTPYIPVRRPRRGRPDPAELERLHDYHHKAARKFKYSGDARFWSTYPSNAKFFKPLANPPPPGSAYHTYGELMSKLELLEALIGFVYAMWIQDYSRNRCADSSWASTAQFITWTKQKWQNDKNLDQRQSMFFSLM